MKKEIQNLLSLFTAKKNLRGFPILSTKEWKDLNDQFDKETIIEALIEYVKTENPEPPMLDITERDMEKCFDRLLTTNHKKFFLTRKETEGRVMEKYDDYTFPYDMYGLGVVQMGNSYCDVSNYFNQRLRMECNTYGFRSAHYRWKNAEDLRSVFLALWRLGNDHLDEYSFVVAFRLASYIATQFKPNVAKFVYDSTGAKNVFDSSCGWGDRLAGFYCSNAKGYYGCDPNPETFEMYKNQCIAYERLLGCDNPKTYGINDDVFVCEGTKDVMIFRCAAEDFDLAAELPIKIDCAFTSPPYFSTERYNEGGFHEEDQSWKRYNTYEDWRDRFYLPVNRKTFEHLADGGIQIVNIQDPKVNNVRYHASDDLINDLTTKYMNCNFIGNLGMRIMQRPKNVDKKKLANHFGKIYIEPMWCFGKNRKSFEMTTCEGLLKYMT